MNEEELCKKLFRIGAVKFGESTLKSGMKSPIYIDLRILVSYPNVLLDVCTTLVEKIQSIFPVTFDTRGFTRFDRIAGIPYAGIPLAVVVGIMLQTPVIYPRKEVKDYGTKKTIEGVYYEGDTILVLDDLITDGQSKLEIIPAFESEGLYVKDYVVLVDREQGGPEALKEKGYRLRSVFKIKDMLHILEKNNLLQSGVYSSVTDYFDNPEQWQETRKE